MRKIEKILTEIVKTVLTEVVRLKSITPAEAVGVEDWFEAHGVGFLNTDETNEELAQPWSRTKDHQLVGHNENWPGKEE